MLPSYAVAGESMQERLPDAVAATNLLQMKRLDAAVALLAGFTTGSHQICLLGIPSVSRAASREHGIRRESALRWATYPLT